MKSEVVVAKPLVSEDVAVDSDPGTESFHIGCWYAVYFKAAWPKCKPACY